MKLKKLSKKCLKAMVDEYHKTLSEVFTFDFFLSCFPDESRDFISSALYFLENDNLIVVFSADGYPYTVSLTSKGISRIEENTLFRKIYFLIKEIVSWL